jgi:hypothetical protein
MDDATPTVARRQSRHSWTAGQVALRLAESAVLLVVAAGLAYFGLIVIGVAGCLGMADGGGYDLTEKAQAFCAVDATASSNSMSFALTAVLPIVLAALAQVNVWTGKPWRAIGFTAAVLLPGFVLAVILRTEALQFLLPSV